MWRIVYRILFPLCALYQKSGTFVTFKQLAHDATLQPPLKDIPSTSFLIFGSWPPKETVGIGHFIPRRPPKTFSGPRSNRCFHHEQNYNQSFHPLKEWRSLNGRGKDTGRKTEMVGDLSRLWLGNFKQTSLWAVDPDSSRSVLRWSGSLSARGKSSPSHNLIDDLYIPENMDRNLNLWQSHRMILVVAFEDSTNYLQLVGQIMYIAPTTVHQCSATKSGSFALHDSAGKSGCQNLWLIVNLAIALKKHGK